MAKDGERWVTLLMERAWTIAALACLLVAAAFYLRGNIDATFVAATLGVVAWFISLRNRLRQEATIADEGAPNIESNDQGDIDEE